MGSAAEKRIDYTARLLSVRRFHSAISSESKARGKANAPPEKPPPSPPSSPQPPLYKSGPVRSPGAVPFTWEEAPGCPREDTPPDPKGEGPEEGKDEKREEEEGKVEEPCDSGEEDAFSDALDTLSRTDSCFMNCSVGGTTVGAPAGSSAFRDPEAREFMMGRFLPAAQAFAAGSPLAAPAAKAAVPADIGREIRRRQPQNHQSRLRTVPRHLQKPLPAEEESSGSDGNDDDWDSCSNAGQLQMKGCGFLPRFCLKGPLGLMNHASGVGGRSTGAPRKRSPAVKPASHPASVGKAGKEMWEEIYKNEHRGVDVVRLEDGSKVTSKSYQLTYWSDSVSPDGSSPYRRSTGGDSLSPCQSGAQRSPFQEGKGLLGFPKEYGSVVRVDSAGSGSRGSDTYFEIQAHLLGEGRSRSDSLTVVKSGSCLDSVIRGSPNLKLGLAEANSQLDTFLLFRHAAEANETYGPVAGGVDGHGRDGCDTDLPPLLPPPLPKSPSESWLSRTLPSVLSKNQAPLSFIGMKFLAKKNSDQISSANPKWEEVVQSSNMQNGQVRFSEILANPIKEDG